jgi:hypothetical protein
VKRVDREQDSLEEWRETRAGLRNLYAWTRRHGWTWQAAGAVSGLGGGTVVAAAGAVLSAAAWLRGGEAGGLSAHGAGSLLLLSTIPLLVSGAHCLDLLERRSERSRGGFRRLLLVRGERKTLRRRRRH